jgi:YcxB-like protein
VSVDPNSFPEPLTFTYREDEIAAYSRLVAAREEPDSNYTFVGVVILAVFLIGLAVFAAHQTGLIPAAYARSVLITAYVAFFAGAAALHGWWILRFRQVARKISAASKQTETDYEVVCDASGVTWRSPKTEARVAWGSIERVVRYEPLVVLWVDITQGLAIPTRAFADDEARQAFVAAVAARIAAARA